MKIPITASREAYPAVPGRGQRANVRYRTRYVAEYDGTRLDMHNLTEMKRRLRVHHHRAGRTDALAFEVTS